MIDFFRYYNKNDLDNNHFAKLLLSLRIEYDFSSSVDYSPILNIIRQHPNYAYRYARDILKCRWPEGEQAILRSVRESYFYAKDVIKDRWYEAERVHAGDRVWWTNYYSHFELS